MIQTEPWIGGTDEEYEAQLFGFGAQRLKTSIRQMIEQKIRTGVKDMESNLQESLNLNETDKVTLSHSCNKIIRLYCERAGPSLAIIDDEIEHILKIPRNVLLPEDEVQAEQISDEEFIKLKEDVSSLRKRVERGALLEALLSAEEDKMSAVDKLCEIVKKDLDVLDVLQKKLDSGEDIKSVQNETQFLCTSVPFLSEDRSNFFGDQDT